MDCKNIVEILYGILFLYFLLNNGGSDFKCGTIRSYQSGIPWIVTVRSQSDHSNLIGSCMGSIIASRYVLTAGHCLLEQTKSVVKIGYSDSPITPEKIVNVSRMMIHPDFLKGEYKENSEKFDIAIVELEEELDLKAYTPICLPTQEDNRSFHEETFPVFSFMDKELNGNNYRNLESRNHTIKEMTIGWTGEVVDYLFLTTGEAKKGDSGGPFSYKRNDQHVLIGELHGLMFPFSDAKAFTKVFKYNDWILSFMESPVFAPRGPFADSEVEHRWPIYLFNLMSLYRSPQTFRDIKASLF